MKIYTSYFAKLRWIPKNIIPISICGKAPVGYEGLQFKTLAPKWSFFKVWKETHDNDYYIKHFYEEVLYHLNATEVYLTLEAMSGGKDIVLVCYEKPDDFCHRHLVAKWFQAHNIECEEYIL